MSDLLGPIIFVAMMAMYVWGYWTGFCARERSEPPPQTPKGE